MAEEKHNLEIVFHYSQNDPEFQADFKSVEVIVNGSPAKKFGDAYRDRGGVQAESYVQGYAGAIGADKCNITRLNLADA